MIVSPSAPCRKLSRGSLALALACGVVGCDPNVVIGSKYRVSEGGTGATGGSGPSPAGAGGATVGGGGTGELGGDAGMAGGAGAGGEPDDGILWSADHEAGSLVEWDEGPDADAGGYYADGESPAYVSEPAHSGNGSAQATIDTAADTGAGQIARLYRRIETREGYYSAWFNLAEDHIPSAWWSIFLFRAVKDRNASQDLWSVNLTRTDADELTLSLYDHVSGKTTAAPSPPPIVPIEEWFQLQAYLEQSYDEPSHLIVWLNGARVFELTNAASPPEAQPVYWVIGNGGAKLTPPISTVYVDDAVISSTLIEPP
ncbi:MAG: hypothetical protein K0R38_667 [Polyangiaceae bacterium]|nr:hypothetical protein [Polyangiaceae bacterium]